MATKKAPKVYIRNMVFRSMLSNRFFFVARALELGDGVYSPVGIKVDITEALQPYLLKKYRKKERA